MALLTAVRVAGHGGFDRVVFEFRDDRLPGYDVAYAEPPIRQSASGDPVAVGGSAFLAVGFEPASGVDLGDTLEETYTGPRRVRGDTAAVVEVVHTGDFEANLDWVVGLRGKARYRVETLTGPARVVIDVATS
ncbi:MAG: AMIN-like domain-containing (lipo)protein [Acidimicrobiales bacterium]